MGSIIEDEIIDILERWMISREYAQNTRIIRYSEVDEELKLPHGSAKKHIEKAAQRQWYTALKKGEATITFEEAPNRITGRR